MSVLMTLHPNDKTNTHFQTLINEWQKVYDQNNISCLNRRLDKRSDAFQVNTIEGFNDFNVKNLTQNTTATSRALKDTTPYGSGGWDPFHRSLERVSKCSDF
jgi:hypothetical protein